MASTGTKTTIKLATLTAAAKDDAFTATEDNNGDNSVKLNVLANDPGAAKLYSVWQPSGPIGATPASSDQLPVVNSATLASGATVTMNADGTITYNAGSGFNHLGAGKTAIDTFSYTARMANGALSIATVSVTITGVNDAASITGTSEGDVTEDGTMSTGGTLTVNDVDDGEAVFKLAEGSMLTGDYGTFGGNLSTGEWTFEGDNGDATQKLGAGKTATQSLTVSSLDGTAEQTITVTITGINDAPVASAATNSVTEDATITGSVSATDDDEGETATLTYALVNPSAAPTGLTLNPNGTYSFDASSYDYLTDGEKLELTIPFTASDASSTSESANLVITITGTTDIISPAEVLNSPSVLRADSVSIKEDKTASGNVLTNDYDSDDILSVSSFSIANVSHNAGETVVITGEGSLTLNADGSFSFTPVADWHGNVSQITYTTNTGSSSTLNITVDAVFDTHTLTWGGNQSGHAYVYGVEKGDELQITGKGAFFSYNDNGTANDSVTLVDTNKDITYKEYELVDYNDGQAFLTIVGSNGA